MEEYRCAICNEIVYPVTMITAGDDVDLNAEGLWEHAYDCLSELNQR